MNQPDWRSQDTPGFREHKGDGAGAGDVEGLEAKRAELPEAVAEAETEARQGAIADEHLRTGWGGEGENYASAQGPNQRDAGEQDQDRRFWDKVEGKRLPEG